jgi:predicted ATP-grasp superfamily ATP-dependent carboligase
MILLTDGQQRKTLAAARSLGSRGVDVLVAEDTRFNPSGFSKYCRRFLVCPNPKDEPERYYEWLRIL